MTRRFDGLVQCPTCKEFHTAESSFERWMRNHDELDSRFGLVRFDCDVLLHLYKPYRDKRGPRDIQCMMFIEVKSRGAELKPAQQDTLSLLSQVLRNRRKNVHSDKHGRHATDHVPPATAWSQKNKCNVSLKLFGGHLLQMSADSPQDSEWMKWDGCRVIDEAALIKLLRFEIDPDTMRPIDWRRRYSAFSEATRQGRLIDV